MKWVCWTGIENESNTFDDLTMNEIKWSTETKEWFLAGSTLILSEDSLRFSLHSFSSNPNGIVLPLLEEMHHLGLDSNYFHSQNTMNMWVVLNSSYLFSIRCICHLWVHWSLPQYLFPWLCILRYSIQGEWMGIISIPHSSTLSLAHFLIRERVKLLIAKVSLEITLLHFHVTSRFFR